MVGAEGEAMTPTVLIFLKAPAEGAVKTRLASGVGDARALAIYRWLVERQLAAIPRGWSVEVHYAPGTPAAAAAMRSWLGEASGRSYWPQPEGDLGARLQAATAAAFGRGAAAVFLIGGDCPELNETRLRSAAAALADHEAVMGPARDGGYYLLGMRAPRLDLLRHITWSTARVAEQTRERAAAAGIPLAELESLADVDTAEDWAPWDSRLP